MEFYPEKFEQPDDVVSVLHGVMAKLLANKIHPKIAAGVVGLCNSVLRSMELNKPKQKETALRIRFNAQGETEGGEIEMKG